MSPCRFLPAILLIGVGFSGLVAEEIATKWDVAATETRAY